MSIKIVSVTPAIEILYHKQKQMEEIMKLRKEIIEIANELEGIKLKTEEEFKKKLKEVYGMKIINTTPKNFSAILKTLGLDKIIGINNPIKKEILVSTHKGHRTNIVIEMSH